MRGHKPVETMTDLELCEACDAHDADCNTFEAVLLEKLLVQAQQRAGHMGGMDMSPKQRAWAERLLEQLDARAR